jgi:hypothetical protein
VIVATSPVTGVKLPAAFTAWVGRTVPLAATVAPIAATDTGASWASSNTTVATVNGAGLVGAVTGLSTGSTTITVTTQDGERTAACSVTVVAEPVVYMAGHFGLYKNGVRDASIGVQRIMDVFADGAGNVHAVGSHHDLGGGVEWQAAYYRNGERTILEMNHGAADVETVATAIFVDGGGDVYISGWETFRASQYPYYTRYAPRLWKNGLRVPLESFEAGEEEHAYATSVRMHNGSVYAVGYSDYLTEDRYNRPAIWKDGKLHTNEAMENFTIKDFGVAAGGALYVLCENGLSWYLDMVPYSDSVWRVSPDLTTWEKVASMPRLDGPYQSRFWARIFVEGDDYYVVGSAYDDSYYWKNGGDPALLERPAGRPWTQADAIHVVNGDVYVGGFAANDEAETSYSLVQWRNGAALTGAGAVTDALPGPWQDAAVRSIFVR